MTKEEFIAKKEEFNKQLQENLKQLNKEYALSNATNKIGDIVTDHLGSIHVEKIIISGNFGGFPEVVYFGIELKKDGTPTKKGDKRQVWQSNIK